MGIDSTGFDFQGLIDAADREDITWIFKWTSHFDWSTWLENLFRGEVDKMAWNSEDWMKNVFGPLIAAAIPEITKAIPEIIKAIIDAFKGMQPEEKAAVLKQAANKFLGGTSNV